MTGRHVGGEGEVDYQSGPVCLATGSCCALDKPTSTGEARCPGLLGLSDGSFAPIAW
jgi:hypothetical protein